jgi:hypothetical protein
VAFLLLANAGVPAQGQPNLAMLSWLTGCWAGGAGIDENWTKAAGGTMFGTNRTVKDGKTKSFEFMRLREDKDGVFFTAWLTGQDPTSFKLISWADGRFVFENPQHDFPQRVIYQRQARGAMTGRIEGNINGKAEAVDFPFRRAKCAN